MDLTGAVWRKSARSGNNGGECVEVADLRTAIGVRDSKDPDGPKLIFNPRDWHAFTETLKSGGYDL